MAESRYWMVVWNGKSVIRKGIKSRHEADKIAERWQGSHQEGRGLLGRKDLRDYIEVKPDEQANREFDERYKTLKAGDPQKIVYTQYVAD